MKYVKVNLSKLDEEFIHEWIVDYSRVLLRIETTNHCNFKCTFCPHSEMQRDKVFIDENIYYKIIDQASALGFKKLDLRNFGEPLLDKRISKFAKYAYDKGIDKIYIHTNGYGLSVKKINEWGSHGICDVNISLSPKREFLKTRPNVNVDRLFSSIERVMKSDSKWKHILSVDYIQTGESTEEEESEFMQWLDDIKLPKRIDIQLHNWAKGNANMHAQCHRLWTSFTILSNGDVSLCCLDYEGEVKFGNIFESSIDEIINNKKYREVRSNHLQGIFLEKCSKCDMTEVKDQNYNPNFVKIG